ncbi:MAG: class I SAM-dependent methyltransferase [Gemmatimonadota bacterium]
MSDVSDTARWVAFYRAMESERPDALFRDPFARRLAGPRGEAIVNALPKGRANAWPMIVRTAVMDEIILRVVKDGVDTVVNLAAGLDARPYRLPLPPTLRWIDVDLPGTIEAKLAVLGSERPACTYETVRLDLANVPVRRAFFQRIDQSARRVLVITEGLLVYLTADTVSELARDLHATRSVQCWLTDLASPGLLRMLAKSWGPALSEANAPFRFGPAEGPHFFGPLGWRTAEYRSTFEEGIRLDRTFPFARCLRWLSRFYPNKKQEEFRYFSGIVLLERRA